MTLWNSLGYGLLIWIIFSLSIILYSTRNNEADWANFSMAAMNECYEELGINKFCEVTDVRAGDYRCWVYANVTVIDARDLMSEEIVE